MMVLVTPEQAIDTAKARALIGSAALSIRRGAGLSLADLAGALDVAPSTIWRWEHGERKPRADLARRYAALLRELMENR